MNTTRMNWRIIWNIALKDWKEVAQNRMAWAPAIIVPFMFVILLPLVVTLLPQAINIPSSAFNTDFDALMTSFPPALREEITGLEPNQMMIMLVLGFMFAPLFLIMPLMISSVVGADSIVGEKERKTLEALLYTPASDRELYLAKVLSAFLPAVLIAWISFIVYTLVVNIAGMPVMGRVWFPLPAWWVMIIWVAPAVAAFGMSVIVMVSSRVSTFMAAQQTAGLLVVPLILILVGQAAGVIYFGVELVLLLGVIIWIIDAVLLWLGVKQFSRSVLMTRI